MRLKLICFLLGNLCMPVAAFAQGATDYGSLHGVFKAGSSIATFKRLIAVPKIQSKNPAVAANAISIVIEARSGVIDVPIDEEGRADFPFSEELVAENPRVVSNQPPGSLRVSLVVEVRPPGSASVRYRDFALAMDDVDSAMRQLGQGFSGAAIEGLEFRFDPAVRAQISISRPYGEDLLVADPQGRVFLRRAKDMSDDAMLVFSAPPRQVLPRVAAMRP